MIKRYSRPGMSRIWSEEQKFHNWVKVEVAVLRAKVGLGLLSVEVPKDLERSITIIVEKINQIELEKTKHDMKAFLEFTANQLPVELRPYWHDRMTSYDTEDTALGLQLTQSTQLLIEDLANLMAVLYHLALEHKHTAMIGRTHMVHAEPITFGVKLALWHEEVSRQQQRLEGVKKEVGFGKLSGAVGMFSLDPRVEQQTCQLLSLRPQLASQIISRDFVALYLSTVANIGGTLKKIADNIRHMQSTEVREVQEYFDPNQTGSSAMPHKRNPISSEGTSGLVEVLRANAQVGFALQNDLHERVLCNSAPERVVLPDSSILLDFLIGRMTNVLAKLIVYPGRMKANLELTRGLFYSQDVQSLIANKTKTGRETAHDLVRVIAQRCWDSGEDFRQALGDDPVISGYVSSEELDSCFSLEAKLQYVDYIFGRAFAA